ncbi:unnamed protein product [Clavelina lepadiformis]|uniref:GB1/RHD3-type G domain-containing protein n=1 Tax=Clavelina lepadiformis TaxID=159417 RepID=A0ABP0G3V9_CLALP
MEVLNLVDITDQNRPKINLENLKEVLCHPDARDRPVAIYSVAGPAKSGKSFLINLFLHYLCKGNTLIEGSEAYQDTLDTTFVSGDGVRSTTKGIYITQTPIVLKTETKKCFEVAVFLMDVQGMFDLQQNSEVEKVLYGFSLLLSSVQFFNIRNNVDANHVATTNGCAELVGFAVEDRNGGELLQRVCFLVRDWEFNAYQLGRLGGECYYKETVMSDANEQVTSLPESFCEGVSCFLLPPPEREVRQGYQMMSISLIGRDFLQNAQDLCVEEFASEHIKPRKVNKAILSGEQLFVLAQTYVHAVNDSDGVLNAHLSETRGNITMKNSILPQCMRMYWIEINREISNCGYSRSIKDLLLTLNEQHKICVEITLKKYDEMEKPEPSGCHQKWRAKLVDFLEICRREVEKFTEAYKEFRVIIENLKENLPSGYGFNMDTTLKEDVENKKQNAAMEIMNRIPNRFHRQFFKLLQKFADNALQNMISKSQTTRIAAGVAVGGTAGIASCAALAAVVAPVVKYIIAAKVTASGAAAHGFRAAIGIGGASGAIVGGGAAAAAYSGKTEHLDIMTLKEEAELYVVLSDGITQIRFPRQLDDE